MDATSIITVLIVIVALSISAVVGAVFDEPLDGDDEEIHRF
jgi:hypothetical protein